MFSQLFSLFSQIVFFILHVTSSNSFPKALNAEEEKKYLTEMKNGNRKAREKLIEHNLRLVAHIIKKYYTQSNEQDDLISIGTIGLIKGIDSYNEGKGTRLSSYASKCIENEILMYFRAQKKVSQDVSMNETIGTDKDGNSLTILDTMYNDENIEDTIDTKINSKKLYALVNSILPEREREIIILRYGLFDLKPLTQREVAKKLGISRSYVSRIEKKVLEKLGSKL